MSNAVVAMDEEPGSPGPPPLQDQNGMEVVAPVQKSARLAQTEAALKEKSRMLKAKEKVRVDLAELNPHIVCQLCSGYLIDPVTVVECLHSFCKSCIVKHVETSKLCPVCQIQIHKTKPLLSLRSDKALQDIVYKVVPGLYKTEMKARLKHYNNNPEAKPANAEDGGEVTDSLFFSPEDDISMSIEYFDNFNKTLDDNDAENKENPNRRFLQCPGSVTVQVLKKLIMDKYSLDQNFLVDVIYKEDLLPEDNTLIDVAYSYNWRKTSPMRFYYRIYQKTKVLTRKRKKKSTKTNNKNHPAKKRKTDAPSLNKPLHNGNGTMEVDEVENKAPKISPKINGDGAKDKINGVKDIKKVVPVINKSATAPKVSFGQQQKPVKSVTINQNVSYSNTSDRHAPSPPNSKHKPLSPILKNVSSDKSAKLPPTPPSRSIPVTETKNKSSGGVSANVTQNSIKANHPSSKKAVTPGTLPTPANKANVTHPKPASNSSNNSPVTNLKTDKKSSPESSVKDSSKEKVTQLPAATVNSKVAAPKEKPLTNGVKHSDNASNIKSVTNDKSVTKIIPDSNKKQTAGENQIVQISVEVSASDVKKVLEKKKAEKDAKMFSGSGEEKLLPNYSIVDQVKKSNAAANLANQKKQASMMDFTRSSEAFSGPKVPPIVQGLQPKQSSGSETNVLSAIVHSLAQKQQSLNQKIQAATSTAASSPAQPDTKTAAEKSAAKTGGAASVGGSSVTEAKSGNSEAEKLKQSEAAGAKTLGTLVTKNGGDKLPVTSIAPKLPISTSIKPITKDSPTNSTSVETGGSKGQQIINFFKNNTSGAKPNTTQESSKNAESLTKNIPAGTTVTVKTVENKQTKSPSPSSTPTVSKSSGSGLRMNVSNSTFSLGKGVTNPFSPGSPESGAAGLMNPLLQTHMTMALAQAQAQQYAQHLSFSNQVAAAALSGHLPGLEAAAAAANANYINNTAANLVRAAAAAQQITQSPMTTLAFTKPISSSSSDNRFGLKIPQPSVSRQSGSPSVSSFGTSRLQVKVNSDSPKSPARAQSTTKSENGSSLKSSGETKTSTTTPLSTTSNKVPTGIHSMPAMIPFHDMKKVQAIPKSVNSSGRSLPISSLLNKTPSPKPNSPSKPQSVVTSGHAANTTDSNPFKTSAPAPGKQISSGNNLSSKLSPGTNPLKTQSLKKLVTDLDKLKQKKADNLHNTLKKNSENLLSESKKAFLGLDQNINEKSKEVTSS